MTPYEINVLLHYHYSTVDHPDMFSNPPIWRPTIDAFIVAGLIKIALVDKRQYHITEKGRMYVDDGLCQVPLPVASWRIPWDSAHKT